MKQAVLSKGTVVAQEVPYTHLYGKGVIVQVEYSCISTGTEMSTVKSSGKNIFQMAKERPQQVKEGIRLIRSRGLSVFINKYKNSTGANFGAQMGYSASGVVIEVGEGAEEFYIGQRVAIAGTGYANHAAYDYVPKNLAVAIPEEVGTMEASTVAVGSIAMQGVQILKPLTGETIVVMGLGLIGQIAVQILKACGCNVIGIDIDKSRIESTRKQYGIHAINNKNAINEVLIATDGRGADAVLFTAATNSSKPMSECFNMLRKKGRFVLLGVSGMEIQRTDIYNKEIEFRIACSYGPGRYDSDYEELGMEYPQSVVKWTENRNMQLYLQMIKQGKIKLESMIGRVFEVERVTDAYRELQTNHQSPLVFLSYHNTHKVNKDDISDCIFYQKKQTKHSSALTCAIVGAGSFVKEMHLPNMMKHPDQFYIKAIMSRTGYSAASTAALCGAEYATTDYQKILSDPDIDMVMITSRHNLHADMAIQALQAGKHVFVEKPAAINEEELNRLMEAIRNSGKGYLVGFNRRFSSYIKEIRRAIRSVDKPVLLEYTMNAGYIPLSSWVHTSEGGGRIIGEGCHIIDLLGYLAGSQIKDISINHLKPFNGYYSSADNVTVSINYENDVSSIMNYIAIGSKQYPKETLNVYFDGKEIHMQDYTSLWASGIYVKKINSIEPSKGQEEELTAFYKAIKDGSLYPIPLEEIEQTTRATIAVTNSKD
ncbi:bi-domain-containing oxidoreductase [Holdemania massiliensis]|uniref:bi-domain-containing oxidoreductase n=1 Tax=Holdemania massiliensis TaxID=1468449 RepID=UPI001F06B1CD|nr:bi-domain-containing oxidoreductase [Holdemania massiliensis]MCH1941113.1 bi-domain-containing oxidoreductase [Holdemania massiliensis]